LWHGKNILVTGGASFIGSHLVDSLLTKQAIVKVADDFSSGKLANFDYPLDKTEVSHWVSGDLSISKGDLKDREFTRSMMRNVDIVFHLAAMHGGRGYIENHPAECCTNMILDQLVFEEAHRANVEKICFASSACVYPTYLQSKSGSSYLLKEEDADPFVRDMAFADREYGWAKLMGEMALKAYHKEYGIKTASVRIFTAYGPRENETHSIIALIAKTFIKMDPFVIWGSGKQDRNFTYVQDIVDSMILAAEKIGDGSAINAGRNDRISIDDAAKLVWKIVGWTPDRVEHDLTKPEGVASRAANLASAENLLAWKPKTSYEEGFRKTIEWYFANKKIDEVKSNLEKNLIQR